MGLFYSWGRFPTPRDRIRARSRAADLCLASGKSARQNCRIWNSKRYNTMIENSRWKETEFFTRENALLCRNLSIAIRLRGRTGPFICWISPLELIEKQAALIRHPHCLPRLVSSQHEWGASLVIAYIPYEFRYFSAGENHVLLTAKETPCHSQTI